MITIGNLQLFARRLWILPIRFYRWWLSPWMGQHCRFHPTCSKYAQEAIMRHGIFKGTYLACWRLLRCNPWAHGGVDPVPENFSCLPDRSDGNAS
ncbi:MAG: membrane protein insertion efficiency factor YidD [Pseudomonadales bacterium]|nr:membrane protein insertion efficiency factor YidD [Pseudomonadales bacterium]